MHSFTLITSALAASALALPQGQLEKRQQLTVTVTVTATVFVTPTPSPAWAGPPKFSDPPNPQRPTNAPSLPVWTPPRPDAFRTSSTTRVISIPTTSSTSRPAISSTSSTRTASSSITPGPSNIGGGTTTRPTASSISTVVIGNPISGTPVPSNAVPPAPSNAPLDPGHTPGVGQASLSVASGLAYRNSILYHHNAARANHGAAPLVWNDTVAATAKITADTCRFEHYLPPGAGQGQNLFTTSGPVFNVTAGITESWYKGEFQAMVNYFGAANIPAEVFPDVGHLTQLLWKGTTSVGCYSIDCGNRMVVGGTIGSALNKYTVCNYYPAGNVGSQYAINVGRPISSTALGRWSN